MTGVKLEKISDIDMYLFIEKETRSGIFYIAKRYSKANNKYMSDYDSNKPSTFITSWIKITFMVGQGVNIFLIVSLNG